MLPSFLLPVALASLVLAAPRTFRIDEINWEAASGPNYTWSVSNWNAGCGGPGCYYGERVLPPIVEKLIVLIPLPTKSDFFVAGQSFGGGQIPPFKAYCHGGGEGAPFDQCDMLSGGSTGKAVAAKLGAVNTTGTAAHLAVSYMYTVPGQP